MPKNNKAKKSAPKAKKSTKTTTPEPVVETPAPVVETPVVDTPVETAGNNVQAPQMLAYDDEFRALQTQLKDAMALVKSAMSGLTALERKVARERKVVEKKMKTKVKRVRDPNAPPSGFRKPLKVSAELQKFLNLPDGELIARTEVTKAINVYCKAHNLQKEEDKRTINADAPLKKLLRLNKGDELTFFNLQKYLKHHYPNKDGVFSN
jgi:chromatin remodeling complex protein RSC6